MIIDKKMGQTESKMDAGSRHFDQLATVADNG
jgi:hypothetical protein